MKTSSKLKDEKALELFRVALTNAESNSGVIKALESSGYNSETLGLGKQLLTETRSIFDACIKNRDLKIAAHDDFEAKKEALHQIYMRDRIKAKLVYRNDPARTALLGLDKNTTRVYIKWIEAIKKFYNEAAADQQIQQDLARLNITMDHINEGLTLIAEVAASRAYYVKLKGEAQDSTEAKTASIAKMKDWMKEFYGVAKLGLKEQPQLLETLGKVVRS